MTREIWFNLPVKDLEKSKAFFKAIGFEFKDERSNPEMECMQVGKNNTVVMLITEERFKHFLQNEITDTNKSNEILISFDAESRNEVDEMAEKVTEAGGNVFARPEEIQGWMYGAAFADLDGHRWNILYMDLEKMSKQ